MMPSESIGKRIVVAFLLYALACSVFFAIVAAFVIEGIEVKLVDTRLEEVAQWASPRMAGDLPVDLPAGVSFHHGAAIPASLRGLPEGVEEITVDGVGLHVLTGRDSRGPYVVIDRESDYVSVEVAMYSMVAVTLLGIMLMSLLLGRYMARRIVTPIVDLSGAVSARQADLPLLERQDELGILARTFASRTAELHGFLDRERTFTGDVSHELRTPLTIITGAAEVVMMDAPDKPVTLAAAGRIYRAARDAAESVDILLQLARAPDRIAMEPVQLAPLVQEEIARHQVLVADKPVTLAFGGGPGFAIDAPARLVAAAVGNLIRNACLYTDSGTVCVLLEPGAVIVRDTGRGLPPAVMDMLSGTRARQLQGSEGTGLGLALVMRICQQLHAQLQVAPIEGGGTTFIIRFAQANDSLTPP